MIKLPTKVFKAPLKLCLMQKHTYNFCFYKNLKLYYLTTEEILKMEWRKYKIIQQALENMSNNFSENCGMKYRNNFCTGLQIN